MAFSRYSPRGRSTSVKAAAAELTFGTYAYERVGFDCRPIRFNADGTVGQGQAGREMIWNLTDLSGTVTLEIGSVAEVTCSLACDASGVWRGRWLVAEKMPIAVYLATQTLPDRGCTGAFASPGSGSLYTGIKTVPDGVFTRPYEARVFGQSGGYFEKVSGSNVLIYFPHGFGDWVQLSTILPLLNRSNRYWIARFGDDNSSVFEGCNLVTPIYLGVSSIHCGDGGALGARHIGMNTDISDGSTCTLTLPLTLYDACKSNEIDSVLYIGFPEHWGAYAAPFHTKARHTLRELIDACSVPAAILHSPLKSCINFSVEPAHAAWVESRLRNFAGLGERRMCLISRNGYSSIGKNWGHQWRGDLPEDCRREGEEARDFMRLMLKKDPRWLFLTLEDRMFCGDDTLRSEELHCYSFAALFGESSSSSRPFGATMKALANLADLAVGVPTGPHHLSMVKEGLPVVGIWIEHLPSWYDEPKEESIHVISKHVRDFGLADRPGSLRGHTQLRYRSIDLETRIISGERVFEAAEALLG